MSECIPTMYMYNMYVDIHAHKSLCIDTHACMYGCSHTHTHSPPFPTHTSHVGPGNHPQSVGIHGAVVTDKLGERREPMAALQRGEHGMEALFHLEDWLTQHCRSHIALVHSQEGYMTSVCVCV